MTTSSYRAWERTKSKTKKLYLGTIIMTGKQNNFINDRSMLHLPLGSGHTVLPVP